jgi:hypothetical protein
VVFATAASPTTFLSTDGHASCDGHGKATDYPKKKGNKVVDVGICDKATEDGASRGLLSAPVPPHPNPSAMAPYPLLFQQPRHGWICLISSLFYFILAPFRLY